jgi:hypothetical protein
MPFPRLEDIRRLIDRGSVKVGFWTLVKLYRNVAPPKADEHRLHEIFGGDCGDSQQYVWDGATFRLVEWKVMGECRGSGEWLTVWRATPRG